VAAWLLVVSSALIAAKGHRELARQAGVQDEFGDKAKAAPLAALAALETTTGVGIFVVGVLPAL
jgi:hypothetical protein